MTAKEDLADLARGIGCLFLSVGILGALVATSPVSIPVLYSAFKEPSVRVTPRFPRLTAAGEIAYLEGQLDRSGVAIERRSACFGAFDTSQFQEGPRDYSDIRKKQRLILTQLLDLYRATGQEADASYTESRMRELQRAM